MPKKLIGGANGCCAMTARRGVLRACAQPAIYFTDDGDFCYYHNPQAPRKFGEGYLHAERMEAYRKGKIINET